MHTRGNSISVLLSTEVALYSKLNVLSQLSKPYWKPLGVLILEEAEVERSDVVQRTKRPQHTTVHKHISCLSIDSYLHFFELLAENPPLGPVEFD